MELWYCRVAGWHLSDYPGVLHNINAVAHRQDLVEAMRDEEEACPPLQRANASKQNVDINLDLGKLSPRGIIQPAPIDEAEPDKLRFLAEIDIFGNGKVWEQRLLLE